MEDKLITFPIPKYAKGGWHNATNDICNITLRARTHSIRFNDRFVTRLKAGGYRWMGVGINENKRFFCFSNQEKPQGKWIKLVDVHNNTKDVIGNRVRCQVEHLMKFLDVETEYASVELGESFRDEEDPDHTFYKYVKQITKKYKE